MVAKSSLPTRSLIKTLTFGFSDHELFLIMCMLCATIQIIYLLELYFSYEFLTRAHVGAPESTILPDVQFCISILDGINYTKLFSNYPSMLRELGYRPETRVTNEFAKSLRANFLEQDLILFFFERLNISQLWDQMISSYTVYSKAVIHKVTEDSIIQLPCSSANYFSEQAYCFSFTCSSEVNSTRPFITEKIDLYKKLTMQEVFTLFIPQSFFNTISSYWITLTPRGQLPRGEKIKWESQSAFKITRKHTFFFYSIETHRLKSPYPTDCLDYHDKGYLSETEMEDKCQIELGIKKFGAPLPSNIIDKPFNASFGMHVFEKNRENATFLQMISDIVDHCIQIAPHPDCYEIVYVPLSRTPLPIQGNYTEITVEQVSDPVYVVDVVPKTSPLDAILGIGNVLGTWLGFSIADSIPQVASFIGAKFFKLPLRGEDKSRVSTRGRSSSIVSSVYITGGSRIQKINKVDWEKRISYNRFPPFYTYYNQSVPPLANYSKARPWWLR